MTTQEFMQKNYDTNKTKWFGNILLDKDMLYSYGEHYPLVVKTGGVHVVNVAPYSSSTARHSRWAQAALADRGLQYINAKLSYDTGYVVRSPFKSDIDKLAAILGDLNTQATSIKDTMATKKRTNTYVYQDLQRQLDTVNNYITVVQQALLQGVPL